MKIIYTLLLILSSQIIGVAQELNVNASVVAPNNTTVDKIIFDNLQVAIREFFNNTKWTNDEFE